VSLASAAAAAHGRVVLNLGLPDLLFLGVLFAVASGLVASMKGRSVRRWSGLGFLFGPLALVAALLAPRKAGMEPAQTAKNRPANAR
jgi:hypothetical protein